MTKTKIKKAIASLGLIAMIASSFGSAFAATTIGQATVTWDASFDTDIIWDDAFPGSATGSVNGIKIKARILPTISMVISDKEIDLGVLDAWIEASGSLDIEIGTNAANGVVVTVKSWSGGLTNTSNNSIQINDLSTDGSVDSYLFSSTVWTHDSTVGGFTQSSDYNVWEVDDSTEHIIYSTDKPEQTDWTDVDVQFNVAATANAQTAAWDYEDNITFTITGNF